MRKPEPQYARDEVPEGMVSLTYASFDELRELGMSVTQAKRVIRWRDEGAGFSSVEDLDRVPGFPKTFLSDIKGRLVL